MKIGSMDKWVTLSRSPQTSPDSDGFFEDLTPSGAWASIQPLAPGDNGRGIQHLVIIRAHPQVTMDTCVLYEGRQLFVKGFQNVDEYDREMRLLCEEVVS